jgi:hypothetical protein
MFRVNASSLHVEAEVEKPSDTHGNSIHKEELSSCSTDLHIPNCLVYYNNNVPQISQVHTTIKND